MRLLRINGSNVDIDEQTAIGIDLQSYDIKNPGQKKIAISNTFSVPITANNLHIIGNPHDPQSEATATYDLMTCSYWIGNDIVIENARVKVTSIKDRISLFVYEKLTIWDELKNYLWTDFISDYVEWLYTAKSLPSATAPASPVILQDFLVPYVDATLSQNYGIVLPMYLGNLYRYDPLGGTSYVEDKNTIYLRYFENGDEKTSNGGHFCTYIKTIFEFFEYKYSVNFLVDESVNGNIWQDAIASQMIVPIRELILYNYFTGTSPIGYYFGVSSDYPTYYQFSPDTDTRDKAGKTMYEFVTAFMQYFNIVKDEFYIGDEKVIRLARFDDLTTSATVVDWSGKIQGTPEFMPYIDGLAQSNIIKHKSIFENGDELINSREITCLNQNIDSRKDLFEIDNYIPAFISLKSLFSPLNPDVVPDLSQSESFKTFEFFLLDGETYDDIDVKIKFYTTIAVEYTATFKLQKAALYSLASEYTLYESINQYPKVYKAKKWLTLNDIRNFEFFKEYWIQELGASFFVNKISGFNPDKSNEATTIELIKTGNRKPLDIEGLELYVDGTGDLFTDGTGDTWY